MNQTVSVGEMMQVISGVFNRKFSGYPEALTGKIRKIGIYCRSLHYCINNVWKFLDFLSIIFSYFRSLEF